MVSKRVASIVGIVFMVTGIVRTQVVSPVLQAHLSVRAGFSIPVGKFSATDPAPVEGLGYAMTGYSIGLEYTSEITHTVLGGLLVTTSVNDLDRAQLQADLTRDQGITQTLKAGSYATIDILGAVGVQTRPAQWSGARALVLAGVVLAQFPDVTYGYGAMLIGHSASSAAAFNYGFECGVTVFDRFDVSARYLRATPVFSYTVENSSHSTTQEMGRVQLTVGVVIF